MLTLSEDAVAFAAEKQAPISIGIPYKVSGCCFDMTECPSVSFGDPGKPADYQQQTIDGVTVFVPNGFPDDKPMTIRTRSFLGFKQLVIDGWKLV